MEEKTRLFYFTNGHTQKVPVVEEFFGGAWFVWNIGYENLCKGLREENTSLIPFASFDKDFHMNKADDKSEDYRLYLIDAGSSEKARAVMNAACFETVNKTKYYDLLESVKKEGDERE